MLNTSLAIELNNLLALGFATQGEHSTPATSANINSFIDDHVDGIVVLNAILDDTGNITDFSYAFINGTAEKLLHRPKRELIGESLLRAFPGTVKEGIFDIYKKVYITGKSTVLQFHYVHEGFDTTFRQKIEKFEDGILIHTAEISGSSLL